MCVCIRLCMCFLSNSQESVHKRDTNDKTRGKVVHKREYTLTFCLVKGRFHFCVCSQSYMEHKDRAPNHKVLTS